MRNPLISIASFVSWHRRAVGALLAALAVVSLAQWVGRPPPAPADLSAPPPSPSPAPRFSVAEGRAVVPVLVPDDAVHGLLAAGDPVTLVWAGAEEAEVVAEARVVEPPEEADGGEGVLARASPAGQRVLLLDVARAAAPRVAVLGQSGQLALVLG